jgi:CheY-like chemotaxis protein
MMATETSTRVLVVDDEPQVVWMLQFSLEAEGYQTYSARDGVSALDEVKEHHPTLMLLDIMMPMMDGWTVLENLRSAPEDERPRVVIVSARRASAIARRPPSSAPTRSSRSRSTWMTCWASCSTSSRPARPCYIVASPASDSRPRSGSISC